MFEFEVCANGVDSCREAELAGATRVELCAGIPEGGTTPSFGTANSAHVVLHNTNLHVIIRPRGGDFLYTEYEKYVMMMDVVQMLQIGAHGIVFGCLKADGKIDIETCKKIKEYAGDMSCTFHRAFDVCADPLEAIDQLAELGFDRILTSGRSRTAEEGILQLKLLQRHAEGKIQLMAGCGVNEKNIKRIYEETGITAYHFSARRKFPSLMKYRNDDVSMGNPEADEYYNEYSTAERIRLIMSQLQ